MTTFNLIVSDLTIKEAAPSGRFALEYRGETYLGYWSGPYPGVLQLEIKGWTPKMYHLETLPFKDLEDKVIHAVYNYTFEALSSRLKVEGGLIYQEKQNDLERT